MAARIQILTFLLSAAPCGLIAVPTAADEPVATVPPTTLRFSNAELSIKFVPGGGAACWADVNTDGWTDLCAGGVVWLNQQGQQFTKHFEGVGDVVADDFDNDGFTDLFSYSQQKLYRNQSGRGFEPWPLPELPRTVSLAACWSDHNGDRLPDLFVAGYEDWDAGITWPSFFLQQQPDHTFKVTQTDARYRARGVTACDFDEDGDSDLYVSNYRLQPNVLWRCEAGQFSDVAGELAALATSAGFDGGHSIGAAWADFNNDGRFDLFAGNFAHVDGRGDQPKSRFLQGQRTESGWKFEDRGPAGVFYQESYASPAAADVDGDGRMDLFFTTVYETASFNVRNQPTLFLQTGEWQWQDRTSVTGLEGLPATYQAAWADFDQDGDPDLVTAGKLWINQRLKGNNWLSVLLRGDGTGASTNATGAQVRLQLGSQTLTRHVEAGTGQGNQNEAAQLFGLADHPEPVTLNILWPGGRQTTVAVPTINRRVVVTPATTTANTTAN